MKRENKFRCLVRGCNFEGKYTDMIYHKKSKHFDQKIDDILFPEDREKKLMLDAIKKILLHRYVEQIKTYNEAALIIYKKIRGAVDIKQIIKMLAHIGKCTDV